MKLNHIKLKPMPVRLKDINNDTPSVGELFAEAMHERFLIVKGAYLPPWVTRKEALVLNQSCILSLLLPKPTCPCCGVSDTTAPDVPCVHCADAMDHINYTERVKKAGGVIIDGVECYGEISQYSNISVVCDDEYNDYVHCDGFPNWQLAVKALKKITPDVVQLSAV